MRNTIITTLALILAVSHPVISGEFGKAISESITQLDSASTADEYQKVVARLEDIAAAENDRWESFYHLAYARILYSFIADKDGEKDAILDEAQKNIDNAIGLGGNKSELYTLQGFLYQGRIMVNMMVRGMSYSQRASGALEKALAENPDNPRAHFLMGQNLVNTPSMFGGGCKIALSHYERAMEAYEKDVPGNGATPSWGKESVMEMIVHCGNR